MAALGSQSIASSYEQLLHVDADGGGDTTVTGNVVIPTAGKGISFTGGTDPDTTGSATANILADYEEGTFTMGFTGATFSNVSQTTGFYTKIGNVVFWTYYNAGMTIASTSGDAVLTGLPFTASSTSSRYSIFHFVHGDAVDGSSHGGYVVNNTTTATFIDSGATAASAFVNGADMYMMVSGSYHV